VTSGTPKVVNLQEIVKLRKEHNKSLADMAHLLGYKTPTGYSYLESGRCEISANQLGIIAHEFNVSIESFYFCPEPTNLVG
jgi:transcriptional regulator with XRE-family HTH domain